MKTLPHPIPYQGSKRLLAPAILGVIPEGREIRRLYEPFAGGAAITIAAANRGLASEFVIGDTLAPLVGIWHTILSAPTMLADAYEQIWCGQKEGDDRYYARIREEFNTHRDSVARLLYLLARCVKNSPRWNREGAFNQSEDKRRLGMHPAKMRRQLAGTNQLLAGRTRAIVGDFEVTMAEAESNDLVYLDPPWEGTSSGRDTRYHRGLERERLVAALDALNRRQVPWILSYDGRCGDKSYGEPLPATLCAKHLELDAGRSSQATLNGVAAVTVESLYVAATLASHARVRPRPKLACVHCGGLARHVPLPDGSLCPTVRVLELLRSGRRAVEAALPEPPRPIDHLRARRLHVRPARRPRPLVRAAARGAAARRCDPHPDDRRPAGAGAVEEPVLVTSDEMIAILRDNAAVSRNVIAAGETRCRRCGRSHPQTYRLRGRDRAWHAQGDVQMSREHLAAREAQIGRGAR